MPKGKYIVIEGNDGTGKSTQVELLAKWLKSEFNIDTFVTHEPDGPGIAGRIRSIIKNGNLDRDGDTNLLLFTAARHEIWRHASAKLTEGTWVISARNYLSTLAYQGYGEGIELKKIMQTTQAFTGDGYTKPDHTIVLSLSHTERKRRINERGELENKDTFESRGSKFQESVDAGYENIAAEYNFPVIDASQSIDVIQEEIRQIVRP
ncbi:dTMP kinase [Candidatus Saccharibacteria bacterium]|nr:dTMP kinase [Candidatus Saccharibacteria bacterium]